MHAARLLRNRNSTCFDRQRIPVFEIEFSEPRAVYHGGDKVSGKIVIEVKDEIKIKGLHIEFQGISAASLTNVARHSSVQGTLTGAMMGAMYTDQEQFLKANIRILPTDGGNRHNHGVAVIPAGVNEFPFEYQLPENLPSSFEGEYGRVKYWARATVEVPKRADQPTMMPFTVMAALDLNQQPDAMQPVKWQRQKSVGWMCCGAGQLSILWSLDRIGYVPGEAIIITGELTNGSRWRIASSKAVLSQHVEYHCRSGTAKERREVANIFKGEVLPGQTQVWRDKLLIPSVPPTSVKGGKLIDVRYKLELTVSPSGPTYPVEHSVDIIIGTLPLNQKGS